MQRLRAFFAQARSGPAPVLFAISAAAFAALLLLPQASAIAAICGRASLESLVWSTGIALSWSPGLLALEWALMVLAMMTPLVAPQIAHVLRSSVRSRRLAAAATFLAAYLCWWLLAGILLLPLALLLSLMLPSEAGIFAMVVLASLWSASPAAQAARNRCHLAARIRAFGPGAYLDCLRQGTLTAAACIAACWPWMLVPMAVEAGHLAAMLAVMAYLFAERIAPAASPRWRLSPAFETVFGPAHLRASARQ